MSSETPSISDETIRDMVEVIEPEWSVDAIKRSVHGTDLVANLEVRTLEGALKVVMKATTADFVDPIVARSEPRFLELLGQETSIPVPTVYGYRDEHPDFPAPFFLMSYEEGTNFEHRFDELGPEARETVLREAGEYLADLHRLGPLPSYGKIGVQSGELTVLDTDEHSQYDDFRDKLLADVEGTLDSLTGGGFFPELADKPDRFADLVPPLREYLRETIPNLPEPEPPTYDYWDYRYGNLLLDSETGEAQAVLDWANLQRMTLPTTSPRLRGISSRLNAIAILGRPPSAKSSDQPIRRRVKAGRSTRLHESGCASIGSRIASTTWPVFRCGTRTRLPKSVTSGQPNIERSSPSISNARRRLPISVMTDRHPVFSSV